MARTRKMRRTRRKGGDLGPQPERKSRVEAMMAATPFTPTPAAPVKKSKVQTMLDDLATAKAALKDREGRGINDSDKMQEVTNLRTKVQHLETAIKLTYGSIEEAKREAEFIQNKKRGGRVSRRRKSTRYTRRR